VFLLHPHFFHVGPWFNPDSYPGWGAKTCQLVGFLHFMHLPFHIVCVFDVEVGPWFNPDSYRDRLGSKNLPIGGFFAFYAYRNKSLRRLKSNLKAILKQQKPIHAGFLSHFFIFHYLLNLHHFL
jgi:hypothetical protein